MIPLWIRFLLLFKRFSVGIDEGADGWTTKVYAKKLFGHVYILKTERFLAPPVHYNCRCFVEPV